MSNQKYEITDIAHEVYPFLHRIRALHDIGDEVKAGDLGGFVESENNLSFKQGDNAWIFDNAISCNNATVDEGSSLRGSQSSVKMPVSPAAQNCLTMPGLRITPMYVAGS